MYSGKYSKYCDVPEDEINNWLDSLLGKDRLNVEQKNEVRCQLCQCLVSTTQLRVSSCFDFDHCKTREIILIRFFNSVIT